jgi:hypothetical protein
VAEAHGDQSAQIDRRGAVMQPVIVLGDAAVADFAVSSRQPRDAAFDHWSMLTVFVVPVQVSSFGADCSLQSVVGADLSDFPPTLAVLRSRRAQPRHAASKVAYPVRLMFLVTVAGQVAVRAVWSTVNHRR